MDNPQHFDIVIVGAGLSGLQTAREISRILPHWKVVVLEARGVIGGRIKNVQGLLPWKIETGAEFIHGNRFSSFKRFVDRMGYKTRELSYPDHYFWSASKTLTNRHTTEKEQSLQEIFRLFADLETVEISSDDDVSVAEYLKTQGIPEDKRGFAESIFANDFGCSLVDLGLHECIVEARNWIYGDSYFVTDSPLLSVVERLATGIEVRLQWVVASVKYTSSAVEVKSVDGRVVTANRAVISVPLTVLKDGDIAFEPPLPLQKQRAIRSLNMSNAVKVVLVFSERFWPPSMFDIVCSDSFLPELWMTERPPDSAGSSVGKFCIVGFVSGKRAEVMSAMDPRDVISNSLQQINEIFAPQGNPGPSPAALGLLLGPAGVYYPSRSPASNWSPKLSPALHFFRGALLVDWSKEAHIRGGYSHPSVGALGAREELRQSVGGRLYFAGEATHPGVNPCLQAAMDTGTMAAMDILRDLTQARL